MKTCTVEETHCSNQTRYSVQRNGEYTFFYLKTERCRWALFKSSF